MLLRSSVCAGGKLILRWDRCSSLPLRGDRLRSRPDESRLPNSRRYPYRYRNWYDQLHHKWISATAQGNSKLYQAPTTGWIGVGTTTPKMTCDVANGNMIARGIGNFASVANQAFIYVGDTSHGIAAYRGGVLVTHGGTA